MEINKRIEWIVRGQALIGDDESIDENKTFVDMGADSLDMVEMLMSLEEEFGCDIADVDAGKIITVNQAVLYILNLEAK